MSEVKEVKRTEETEVKTNNQSVEKKGKSKKKKANAFVRFFKWIGTKCKEMWLELKNVTWPSLPKVVKQTGVVLGVILVFLILVTAIEAGFTGLHSLLFSGK